MKFNLIAALLIGTFCTAYVDAAKEEKPKEDVGDDDDDEDENCPFPHHLTKKKMKWGGKFKACAKDDEKCKKKMKYWKEKMAKYKGKRGGWGKKREPCKEDDEECKKKRQEQIQKWKEHKKKRGWGKRREPCKDDDEECKKKREERRKRWAEKHKGKGKHGKRWGKRRQPCEDGDVECIVKREAMKKIIKKKIKCYKQMRAFRRAKECSGKTLKTLVVDAPEKCLDACKNEIEKAANGEGDYCCRLSPPPEMEGEKAKTGCHLHQGKGMESAKMASALFKKKGKEAKADMPPRRWRHHRKGRRGRRGRRGDEEKDGAMSVTATAISLGIAIVAYTI